MQRTNSVTLAGKRRQFAESLLRWFAGNKRNLPWREESDLYRLLIAEKLLQQTDAGHVLAVYRHFFEKFPTLKALADAELSGIEEVLRPLGFWKIRARDLKLMAMQIIEENNGAIPTTKESLLELHGVGRYIATAFYCFAFGRKEAIVDVNVRRVAKRLFFWQECIPADHDLERFLLAVVPANSPKDFNWALLDFSSKVCSRKPHCDSCFATPYCQYYKSRFDGSSDQLKADIT